MKQPKRGNRFSICVKTKCIFLETKAKMQEKSIKNI